MQVISIAKLAKQQWWKTGHYLMCEAVNDATFDIRFGMEP